MEKSKNEPIDPLLAQQYFADAANKARGIIEWPAHEIAERPSHELLVNPDREAERKAALASQDYRTMRPFHEDDVSTMRNVRKSRELSEYAESMGKNPDTYAGPIFRGTTDKLVGDSKSSVFTKFEDWMIKTKEQEILDHTEKAGKEFVDKLPEGTPLPTVEEQKRLRNRPGGLFIEEPFDQDKVA